MRRRIYLALAALAMIVLAAALGWRVGRGVEANRQSGADAVPEQARRQRSGVSSAKPVALKKAEDRPLPALSVPLRDVIGELRRRADAGEGAAACRLAAEIEYCDRLQSQLFGASEMLRRARAASERMPRTPEAQRQMQRMQQMVAARSEKLLAESEHCSSVPEFSPKERVRYWRTAATAGNLPALRHYAVGNAFRLNDTLETLDELRVYRREAETMALRAVEAGDAQATLALAAAYSPARREGRRYLLTQSVAPDAERALALYLLAAAQASSAPNTVPGLPKFIEENIEELESELDAGGRSRVRERAAALRTRIAKPVWPSPAPWRFSGGSTPDVARDECGSL